MTFRPLLFILLFLLAGNAGMAQLTIQLPSGGENNSLDAANRWKAGKLDFQSLVLSGTSFSNDFRMPSHVETNPRGYSPLCRLELRIEDQLPVGVWVKLGEKPLTPSYLRSNAEVRFKLFKF